MNESRTCAVVGIGASAGGLAAMSTLFDAAPTLESLAFIIVQHLDPKGESHLVELLARHTPLAVGPARDGRAIEPGHIYVCVPNRDLVVSGGRLRLVDPETERSQRRPIDRFFDSLAAAYGDRAVAVILSGTAMDGSRGIAAVKAAGGTVIAQAPETAEFDGMPRSAISTGLVDLVLPVEKIARALASLSMQSPVDARVEPDGPVPVVEAATLQSILRVLHDHFDYDFADYKRPTLLRRTQRRMSLRSIDTFDAYAKLVRDDANEAAALFRDLMINVSSFFRDPAAWEELERQVIDPLIARRDNGDELRVWSVGCATGEEAYTLGMLLLERIDAAGKGIKPQIFATDVSDSLESARAGVYPETITTQLSPRRVERFFIKHDSTYEVRKPLRDMIVFARHNVITAPPFSRMDLICCRNMLIYIEPETQRKILWMFNFALRDGGTLFLGSAETIGTQTDLFEPLSAPCRIFRSRRLHANRFDFPRFSVADRRIGPLSSATSRRPAKDDFLTLAQRALLDRYAPPSVVIDAERQVLVYHGDTSRYLMQPGGEPTRDLLALVAAGVRPPLRHAINEAIAERRTVVTTGGYIKNRDPRRPVRLTVSPLGAPREESPLMLVSFEETPEPVTAVEGPGADEDSGGAYTLEQLEEERRLTRQDLHDVSQQYDRLVEEYSTSNEEMLSINEELQSANEELETCKEELQSLNEELNTLNNELRGKIEVVEQTNNDLNNLLVSTEVATVFLDMDCRVRWFTPAIQQVLRLIASDVGRPIADLASTVTGSQLQAEARGVLQNLIPVETEVVSDEGKTFIRRVLPYRTSDNRIAGVVATFVDITEHKRAEAEQRRLAERLATTLENITDGYFTLDPDWRFIFVNAEAERMVDRRRDELIGITLWEAFPETLGTSFEREYRRAVERNVTVNFVEYFPPLAKWFEVRACPSEQGLAVYFRDVTASRELTAELVNEQSRLVAAQAVAKVGSWETDLSTMEVIWSAETYRIFEMPPDGFSPTHPRFLQLVHPEERETVDRAFQGSLRHRAPRMIEHRIVMPDGRLKFVEERWQVVFDEQEKPIRVIGTCQDITERKQAEEALRLRDRAIQAVSQGILITDPNQTDNPIIFASAGFERMTGHRSDEVVGKNCRFLQGQDTDQETVRELRSAISAARSCAVEILNYRKDGKAFWNELTITPVLGPAGQLTHFVGVQTDITERRRLEEQYRQAQKMEAVGRLAGGVAHDFNNLLTIISGYSELLLDMPHLGSDVREAIADIREAGERAASLTRQLLGFSRQSILQPKVLDLNAVVTENGKLLRRLIGEDILFTMVLDPQLSRVKVDPGQLEHVLMNLAVNARDAMPMGGKLTVETSNVLLGDDSVATPPGGKAGHHVMLAMSDTGCGMTPEVMARIFEPFYTTKEVGMGTGLGLAMVFGFVQQSGGCIQVHSEPGRGTTFKVYLPAVSEQLAVERGSDSQAGLRGTETILLVEDEEGVRGLALMSLKTQGYQVLSATDGKDALNVLKDHRGPLDLILTDIVMPNISGPVLVQHLKANFPGVKVLFMSGYTDDAMIRHGLIEADVAFIQKPYTPLGLSRKVRQVLDEKSTDGG
jgi:two-component system CheB/CheR fusion protein